ncbi:MAG: acyltransferase [Bacteroidales bacterium]|nr:acyltransferase [Bacteroidales bacterium]
MPKTARNYTIDLLRIIACFAVVMAHVIGVPIMSQKALPGTFDYNLCLFLIGVRRWGVPIFLMITGFFMLDPAKESTLKKLYSKNILRILTALIFWSGVYALVLHKPFYPLGSQETHFWYLGVIIGVYVAVPVLRLITANARLLRYFIIAWLCVMTYSFVGRFVTLPFDMQDVIFVKFSGYCVLGYYIKYLSTRTASDCPNIVGIRRAIYWIGLLGLLVTAVGCVISQNDECALLCYESPNMICCSAAILLYGACHPLRLSERASALILNCSECTFGIYLVHVLILIEIYNRLGRFVPQTVPHMVLAILIAFFVGYGVTYLLKKIPVVNKYIV